MRDATSARRVLLGILVVSVLLRVGVALSLGDQLPRMQDDYSYSLLAERLTGGHGYTFPETWYPFTPGETPTAHWSFLYTAFLAGIYAVFGVHPLAARLVQAVLGGVLLPWMVYRLARRAQGEILRLGPSTELGMNSGQAGGGRERERGRAADGVPLIAAGIAAIYAYYIVYAARPVTETFFIVAVLWSLERALALADDWTLRQGAVLGLSLGVATLLRQSTLPWVVVLFAWLVSRAWWDSRRPGARWRWNVRTFERWNVGTLTLAGVVLAACIAPFTIRNYLVYDDFLLLNSNAGYAMYSAQHPMHGTVFEEHDAAPLPEDLRGQGLSEPEFDRELMRRGIGFVLEKPGRYLLLSLSRVEDYLRFWPTGDSPLLYNIGRVGSFGVFLPFMVFGVILAVCRTAALHRPGPIRRNARSPSTAVSRRCWATAARLLASPVGLLLLFMASYSLLHILTWAMTRYRLPVDAVGIVFAGLAIRDLTQWMGKTAHRLRSMA